FCSSLICLMGSRKNRSQPTCGKARASLDRTNPIASSPSSPSSSAFTLSGRNDSILWLETRRSEHEPEYEQRDYSTNHFPGSNLPARADKRVIRIVDDGFDAEEIIQH